MLGDWLEIQRGPGRVGACGEGTQGREGKQEASTLAGDGSPKAGQFRRHWKDPSEVVPSPEGEVAPRCFSIGP